MAHYHFETIHPFPDGNGRIGRLLITLYLVQKKILVKPALYLSDFFEKNKSHYYDNLMRVRTHHNMNQWLKFFLVGVKETSENSVQTFRNIISLRSDIERNRITKLGKKTLSAQKLLNYLYTQPIVDSSDVAKTLDANISTALRMIDDFEKLNILKEKTGYKRNRVFEFREYLDLFA